MQTPQASDAPQQATLPTSGNQAIHLKREDHDAVPSTSRDSNAYPSTSRDSHAYPRPLLPTADAQTQYVAPVPAGLFAHQAAPIVVRPKAQPLLRPPASHRAVVGGKHGGTEGAAAVAPIAPPQERPAAAVVATTATAIGTAVAVAPWNTHVPNPVALIAPRAEMGVANPARPAEPPAQVDDERPGPSAPREGQMRRQQANPVTTQDLVREVVS